MKIPMFFNSINFLAILRDLFGVVKRQQRSGMKGSRIELPGSCFSCSFSLDTYQKFTIELGLGWTWQIDCEALPTGRGNSSTGLVPTLYQAGNNWAVRIVLLHSCSSLDDHFPYRMVGAKDRNNVRVENQPDDENGLIYFLWKLGRHQLPQLQLGFQRYFWSLMFRWLVVGRVCGSPICVRFCKMHQNVNQLVQPLFKSIIDLT